MKQAAYCLFETPLGTCGIAWKEQETSRIPPVVTFFQLPEATRSLTDTRIAGSSGGRKARVPPPHIAGIIKKVQKHLHGDVQDFLDIVVDLDAMGSFARQVYEAVRKIPAGRTKSYGELATDMNRPTASRAVGQALGRNPIPLIIPCHRVLASGNKPGGFSAHGGLETKAKMLEIEGATIGLRQAGDPLGRVRPDPPRRTTRPKRPRCLMDGLSGSGRATFCHRFSLDQILPIIFPAACSQCGDFDRPCLLAGHVSHKNLRRSVIPCLFSKFPKFAMCAFDDTRTAPLFTAARTTRMSRK